MRMRELTVILFLAALSAGPSAAEDAAPKPPSSVMSWLKNWKNSLERSAVEGRYRRMRTATAVAAVRGECQNSVDPAKPYWKGGWSEKCENERLKERKELASAVTSMMDGREAEARQALDAFEKAHPQSSFLSDVAEARAKLDEGKPTPPPEPAKEPVKEAPKEPEAKKPEAAAAEPAKTEPAKTEAPVKAETAPAP